MAMYETTYQANTTGLMMRPGVETAQTPDEMAPCVREALMANGALDGLARALSELEGRLYQVLLPAAPQQGPQADTCPNMTSPLHGALLDINERIGTYEGHVMALIARLTV